MFSKYDEKYENTCGFHEQWLNFYKIFALIDTIQAIFIPYLILFMSYLFIIYKMITKSHLSNSNSFNLNNLSENDKNVTSRQRETNNRAKNESLKVIFLIVTSYLMLNFPIVVFKTRQFIYKLPFVDAGGNTIDMSTELTLNSNITIYDYNFDQFTFIDSESINKTNHHSSATEIGPHPLQKIVRNILLEEILNKFTYYVYYINFSIKFFVYIYKKKQFRDYLFNLIK